MMDPEVWAKILEQLDKLPLPEPQRVVEFAKSLSGVVTPKYLSRR